MGETKRFLSLILFLYVTITLFGCATNRVPKDLAAYMNQGILNISELETKSLMRYASVNCKRCDITDEEVYDALKHEVIPNYKRFLYLLRDINPETDEVRALHVIFIQGAEMIDSGFKIKMIGIESKDPNLIRAAEDKIDSGMMAIYEWKKKLTALFKEHKVGPRQKKWYSSWY